MAETMEQTLESQERYEEKGPCLYWYPGDDEEYDFYWNGVYGDPIQVESTVGQGIVDLIPTTISGDQPESVAATHLAFFELLSYTWLKKKSNGGSIEITFKAVPGVEDQRFVMNEDNTVSRHPEANAQAEPPDLSRFFPEGSS